ncbi:MAG: monovalent cation:proton antiporter-2 (CPA2) family protein [Chromatiales bacterium]|nr:monovalent cation:proton antiporter-2 (CPA2) family protein [Chromatiales bacterium]
MTHDGLIEALILLAAAVLIVPLFQFLRLGAVLGFLAAGMIIGPGGLELVTDVEEVRTLAELGVVFLLFIIGIELKPARLWLMRRQVFGMGSAQVLLTGLVLTLTLVAFSVELRVATLLGLGLALSSTAFVLQILTERRELGTPYGRTSFAILLLQDLAVVPLLALVPLLAQPDSTVGGDIGLAVVEAVAMVLAVILFGRLLLRPLLHRVALHGSQEIFLATALLLVLGIAVMIEKAGMSMAMGAFLAGLLIADSEFRHQIMADIQPFRAMLLGLFFMAVGMSVELSVLLASPLRIAVMLVALIVIKASVLWLVARMFGVGKIAAKRSALLLAQGGEFAFVLFGAGFYAGLLEGAIYQEALLVVALSMVVTPLLAMRSKSDFETADEEDAGQQLDPAASEDEPEVLIAGFGRMGMRIATLMQQAGVRYVAIEQRLPMVTRGRSNGYAVYFGNAAQHEVLHSAGVSHAKLMVVAIDNPEVVEHVVAEVRRLYPKLPIYARGHSRHRCESLIQIGATGVASENLEASLQLAKFALIRAGVDEEMVEQQLESYRYDYYNYLKHQGEER